MTVVGADTRQDGVEGVREGEAEEEGQDLGGPWDGQPAESSLWLSCGAVPSCRVRSHDCRRTSTKLFCRPPPPLHPRQQPPPTTTDHHRLLSLRSPYAAIMAAARTKKLVELVQSMTLSKGKKGRINIINPTLCSMALSPASHLHALIS